MASERSERLRALFLSKERRLLLDVCVAHGDRYSVDVPLRRLAALAVRTGATAMILAHNHPSGDPTPSAADYELTKRVATLGRLIEVRLVDHLIVARRGVSSMRAAGVL